MVNVTLPPVSPQPPPASAGAPGEPPPAPVTTGSPGVSLRTLILSVALAVVIAGAGGFLAFRLATTDDAEAAAPAATATTGVPRALLDEHATCVILVPVLTAGVDLVLTYAEAPNKVEQAKLLGTISDLRSVVDIAPTTMRPDIEVQLATLQQIQRAMIGGQGPTNLQPFKDSGVRLATRCLPYATDVKAPPATTAAAGPKTTISNDGTFLVGVDFVPGTYRTTVPASSRNCYWARLSGVSGAFDDIIANENTPSGGQAVVSIPASDKAFQTRGCGTWQKIG